MPSDVNPERQLHNNMFAYETAFALQTLINIAQGLCFLHSASPPLFHADLKFVPRHHPCHDPRVFRPNKRCSSKRLHTANLMLKGSICA